MININPYHEGELAVQKKAGESFEAKVNGSMISNEIPFGASGFIAQQRLIIIGTMDSGGGIWTSILFGNPGCVKAINQNQLEIDFSESVYVFDNHFQANIKDNSNIGILMIELESRRRLRVNGKIAKTSAHKYTVNIDQAYANCPKYIQRRQLITESIARSDVKTTYTTGNKLNDLQKKIISSADTFFVSSASPEHGIDASHRGGNPGFVRVLDDGKLLIPDFKGNSMFNTLGNFSVHPFAGLLFIDFHNGKLLQLSGRVRILWDNDDPQKTSGGTRRFWQFETKEWREFALPENINWEFIDYSPYNPETINETSADDTILLKVERIQLEADNIKSFQLRPMNNGDLLPEFQPGSHIQVQVRLPDHSTDYRHYSLLSNPNNRSMYTIAVLSQPDGRGGSLYLHKHIHEGDILEVKRPQNNFPVSAQSEHSILIAGGIGVTPILSMLEQLVTDKQSFEFHYSARKHSEFAFYNKIKELAGDKAHFYASREANSQRLNIDALLSSPKPRTHIYVCGPRRMIAAIQETSKTHGWSPTQVHFESFGSQLMPDDQPIRIHLAKSKQTICVPPDQTILDTLLKAGIKAPFQCKRGECSMCLTRVLAGQPEHRDLCLSEEERKTSMLICVSRAQGKTLTLDL